MLKKEELQSKGFEIIDKTDNLANDKQQKLDAIKNIIPDLISSDGQLNTNKLQEILGININNKNTGYELQFLGKPLARAKAYQDTKYELKTEKNISKNFDTTSNIVIKGDNIDVLKILKQNYQNKIKMIYIDPPYNTGNDGFIYQDNFKDSEQELCKKFHLQEEDINLLTDVYKTTAHSSWLSFIYPRLLLARELLTEDGCIFISIDDNEQANLKIICDEIFGESNFVANLVWENREGGGKSDSKFFRKKHEYILVYSKKINISFINAIDIEDLDRYSLTDDHVNIRGKYQLIKLNSASIQYSKSLDYPIYHNGISIYPSSKPNKSCWRWSKDKLEWGFKNDFVVIKQDKNNNWVVYTKQYTNCDSDGNIIKRTIQPTAVISKYSTTQASNNLKILFDNKVFDYSKPYELIQYLISLSTESTNTDIILDFFAGSGTTGHAVMELNKQDGGNRKFILVQKDEKIDEKSESYKFCEANNLKPVISSITIERLNRAGQKLIDTSKELDISNLDSGYKVFSLIKKPKLTQANQQIHIEDTNKESLDIFFNMLAKTDKPLTTSYTKITENLFLVTNPNNSQEEILYITDFKETDIQDFKKYQPTKIYLNGYANIELHNFLSFFTKENTKIIY